MLKPIPVILSRYDTDWPLMAARFSRDLCLLGVNLVAVHHIGSTAVPGLVAKPIIDLMPLVNDLTDLDRERGRIESLGYGWHGEYGIAGRRYCTLCDEVGVRAVQLHFFKTDSPQRIRHLAFRDYLRAHPEAAREYETVKLRARDLHPNDSHAYTHAKSAWIQATEATALAWFSGGDVTL